MKKTLFCFALFLGVFVPVSQAQVTVAPFISPAVQFFDNNGDPLTGGKVCTFAAGTSTPLGTYSDLGITLNSNPVILDSAGRGTIYLTAASYKIVIAASTADSSCNPAIKSQDNITWSTMANTVTSLISNGTVQVIPSTAATSGANQSSPNFKICGNYWTGSASAADCWNIQDVLGTGSNPTTTFNVTHSGSSGTTTVNFAPPLAFNNSTLTNSTLAGTTTVTGIENVAANITATAGANTINAGNINNGIHIDGVKYPITQSGIQQAFTDACALGNGNGTDVYLPAATTVTLSNVATSQFTITCPLHVHGPTMGSFWFVIAASVPSTVPTFLIKPSGANLGYWEFDHIRGTTAASGATGGDWFFLDTTNGDVSNFIVHDSSFTGQCAAGGSASCDPSTSAWFINMNTAGGASHVFTGNIYNNNQLEGGINCNAECSDSWRVSHNVFGSSVGGNTNPCMNATTFNNGTAMFTADNNNGGCKGGFFISHGTLQCLIINNQIEQPLASSEANSAIIDLMGDTYTIDACKIENNNIGSDNLANINIRLDHASNIVIKGNVIGPNTTAGSGITLTANPTNTFIDGSTNEFVISGSAVRVTNGTASNPFTISFPKSDGTLPATVKNATDGGLLLCSNGGKCWTLLNSGSLFNCTGCNLGLNGTSSGSTSILMQANAGGTFTPLAMNSGSMVKLQVASDFTTTSVSLATITGLTFTQLANATNYSFHCELAYSQATAAAANAFGIQVATNNPTNVFATGKIWTAAGTVTSGVLATLATTTATNIVSFTPSATATNFVAELSGTVELPASANTVNFMALTGSASDALTIKRGSYCQVW